MGLKYDRLKDDYSGIKIKFNYVPIRGDTRNTQEFIITAHDLLIMALQSMPLQTEFILEKVKFDPDVRIPIVANNVGCWLDVARMLEQRSGNTTESPELILDVGRRKLSISVPSDRYFYDRGKFPEYRVSSVAERLVVEIKTDNDARVVMDPKEDGENPLRVSNAEGKAIERLSYIDFYRLLREHYGNALNSAEIVGEIRSLLAGNPLSTQHATVLPVMLATMFAAEVSRNRACMLSGLLLLDLIESRVPIQDDFYRFENVLWHPELYKYFPKERRKNPVLNALGELGGLFSMAHRCSYSEEFRMQESAQAAGHVDTPYQSEEDLSWANVKSVVILIDWLCNLDLSDSQFTITKVNANELQDELRKRELDDDHEIGRKTLLVLSRFIVSLVQRKLRSFDNSLRCDDRQFFSDAGLLQPGAQILRLSAHSGHLGALKSFLSLFSRELILS